MAHDKYLDLLTEMVLTDHKTVLSFPFAMIRFLKSVFKVTCSSLCDILDVDPNLSKRCDRESTFDFQ